MNFFPERLHIALNIAGVCHQSPKEKKQILRQVIYSKIIPGNIGKVPRK